MRETNGAPVYGAQLLIQSHLCPATGVTGPDGLFEVQTTANARVFDVARIGEEEFELKRGDLLGHDLELIRRPLTPVTITVIGDDGRPVPHARVLLIPPVADRPAGSRATDDSGRVRFFARNPGLYRALVQATGASNTAWVDVMVTPPTEAHAELDLRGVERDAEISGSGRDAAGNPAAGCTVEARLVGPPMPLDDPYLRLGLVAAERASAITTEDGEFRLESLRPGRRYDLELSCPRRWSAHAFALAGGPRVQFAERLEAPPQSIRVRGRVVDPDGQPVASFSIGPAEFSRPDGRFEVESRASAKSRLMVDAPGFLLRRVEFPGERDAELGDIRLEKGRRLRVAVVDARGAPLVGAAVHVEGETSRTQEAETDGDGVVEWSNVARTGVRVWALPSADSHAFFGADVPDGVEAIRLQQRVDGVLTVDLEGRPSETSAGVVCDSGSSARPESRSAEGPLRFEKVSGSCTIIPDRGPWDPMRVSVAPGGETRVRVPMRTGDGVLRVFFAWNSEFAWGHLYRGEVVEEDPARSGSLTEDRLPAWPVTSDAVVISLGQEAFQFSRLSPGTYTLFAGNSYDQAVRTVIDLRGGQIRVVEIPPPPF